MLTAGDEVKDSLQEYQIYLNHVSNRQPIGVFIDNPRIIDDVGEIQATTIFRTCR